MPLPPQAIRIIVADDMLSARVLMPARYADRVTAVEIANVLREKLIVVNDADIERIGRYVRGLRRGEMIDREVIIVKATPPVHGRNGRIIDTVSQTMQKIDEKGNTDHYQRNALRIVAKGEQVLRVIPPTSASVGRNVYGQRVEASIGVAAPLHLGPRLILDAKNGVVSAEVSGQFHFDGAYATIEPDLKIHSSVSFASGNIDFDKDVVIDKDVFTNFEVNTDQSVIINGTVEGAAIEAGRDVRVRNGVLGKRKGKIVSGGSISCEFANGARMTAAGDISVDSYCYDSTLQCTQVRIGGTVAGGTIVCAGGSVGMLGSIGNRKASVTIRDTSGGAARASQHDKILRDATEELAKQKEAFSPYEGKMRRLAGRSRETALKIQARIEEINDVIALRREKLGDLSTDDGVVGECVFEITQGAKAGTIIDFEGIQSKLREDLDGHYRLELHYETAGPQIMAVDVRSGEVTKLPIENEAA